ncbi:MAG: hypothetical protein IJ679_01790 [Lachnospiraceae bacterium]|nr:hypothetical protein [Lachnospiraceae bacterium]
MDCEKLVGGNGTFYSRSNHIKDESSEETDTWLSDIGYAHIDVAGNPGYLTDVAMEGQEVVYLTGKEVAVATIPNQTYTGKEIKPVPTITFKGKKLLQNTDL